MVRRLGDNYLARFQFILVQSANGVRTITLNRPEKRNALSPVLIDELTEAFHEAESGDCGVVILTGAGSAFCAGQDFDYLESIHWNKLAPAPSLPENVVNRTQQKYLDAYRLLSGRPLAV